MRGDNAERVTLRGKKERDDEQAPRDRKFSENCGGLRRRADKERARLIEKICKAGGASPRHRLIRIRVSFGLWFRLRVVGCHQECHRGETRKNEREKDRDREGEREGMAGHGTGTRPTERKGSITRGKESAMREGSGLEHSQSSD